ncbi:MAG: GNAT family N-acetyltransferase [Oscillospiraceae bacterium]|nr:GNAT family N-acetyltransferase [Oscillospiraceae bacterium]
MIETYKPRLAELDFRQSLMADKETMSYNEAWGGTIPFPEERWEEWYQAWLDAPESQRYYRYLYNADQQCFVGEIAYHYETERKIHLCDVIVLARYRNRGFGTIGIQLLCKAARENGVSVLYDDIAADNPSYKLFLKNGFVIDHQNEAVVMVKKLLR